MSKEIIDNIEKQIKVLIKRCQKAIVENRFEDTIKFSCAIGFRKNRINKLKNKKVETDIKKPYNLIS